MTHLHNLPQQTAVPSSEKRRFSLQDYPDLSPLPLPRQAENVHTFPLSDQQQRLWFLEQQTPGHPVSHLSIAVRLRGHIDARALETCLNLVVARHSSLRTSLSLAPDAPSPAQHILPSLHVPLLISDLSWLVPGRRESIAHCLLQETACLPFNLRQPPLLRALLLPLDEQEALFLLCLHHIISDDWSLGLLLSEMAHLYPSCLRRPPARALLPPLSLDYADYALWQRQQLTDETVAEHMRYWRQRLRGAPALLALPTDHPRPPVQSLRGRSHPFALSPRLTADVRSFSDQQGLTPFLTLLASFQILLARYSGQADLCVGVPVTGRSRPGLESLIGLFATPLVLRADLAGNPCGHQVLAQVKARAQEAFVHQELPFARLLDLLAVERSPSHTPLFQVLFAWQDTPAGSTQLPGLHTQPIHLDTVAARYDLSLFIQEQPARLAGRVVYSSDLFEPATIQRLLTHWETLLASLLHAPHLPISDLELLPADERSHLLRSQHTTSLPLPCSSLLHLLDAQASRSPDALALVCGPHQLSYSWLHTQANALAFHLRHLGITPEVTVGLCMTRSPALLVALLAILKAGGACILLDPACPSAHLRHIVADARMKLILVQEHTRSAFACWPGLLLSWEEWVALRIPPCAFPPACHLQAHHLAYVSYTAGSTGLPQGVAITQQGVVNFLAGLDQRVICQPSDILLALTGISSDTCMLELLWPLTHGARVVVATATLEDSAQPRARSARSIDFRLFYIASDHEPTRLLTEHVRRAAGHHFNAAWLLARQFHGPGGLYANPSALTDALAMVTAHLRRQAGRYPEPETPPGQRALPIPVVNASSRATFLKAGEIGAHVLTLLPGQTIEEVGANIALYRESLARHGFDPGARRVTLVLPTCIGERLDEVREQVREPFCASLKSSPGLLHNLARNLGLADDVEALTAQDIDNLVAFAFDRYFQTAALFGTPRTCLPLVERLKAIQVDEIACLIDLRGAARMGQTHLQSLARLRALAGADCAEEPVSLPHLLAMHPITLLHCTPSVLRQFLFTPSLLACLTSLRSLLLDGEALSTPLTHHLLQNLPATLFSLYGCAETTLYSAIALLAPAQSRLSCGPLIANTRFYVLDHSLHLQPIGVPGELSIGGPGLARSYLGRPDLTAERFLPDSCGSIPGARLYRTGVRARYRPDGSIEILGRVNQQVTVRGYRIELGAIEAALRSHPAVRAAAVVMYTNASGADQLAGYVSTSQPLSPEELRRYLQRSLPEYMLPTTLTTLERFPSSPNGKLNRRALPPAEHAAARRPFVAPATPIEQTLAEIWQELLGKKQIGIHANFFALGADSRTAVLLASSIRATFHIALPLREIVEAGTIARLAEKVARLQAAQDEAATLADLLAETD